MGPAPRAPHRGDVPGGGPQRRPRPRGPGRVDRRHRPDRHREGRGLVCYSLDRLAREITVQEAILAKVWEEAGGQVFTTDHGEVQRDDPDDPMRTAMRKMAGVMYELDRRLVVAWIGPEHLLDALVHPDCPGAARAVLASLGITAERLQQARDRSFIDPFEPGSG